MDDSKLRLHTVRLCDELNLDKLLPYLRQERMVTNDEYEILTNIGYTKRQRRSKLLIMLPRKGRDYFANFGKCLVWSGQTELARHIGVDVDNVPPSPHQFVDDDDDDPYGNAAMRNQVLLHALQEAISAGTPTFPPPRPPPPPGYSVSSPIYLSGPQSATIVPESSFTPQSGSVTDPQKIIYFRTQSASMPDPANTLYFTPESGDPPSTLPPHYYPSAGGEQDPMPTVPPMTYGSTGASVAAVDPSRMRSGENVAAMEGCLPPSAPNMVPHHTGPSPQQQRVQSGPPKVFILYCKDELLQNTHGVTPDDFCKDIQELADILSTSGITCRTDFYERDNPSNWNIWTQNQIKSNDFVVMIASPKLHQHLSTGTRADVDMERGKYFNSTVINTIVAPKYVPVFLNGYEPPAPASPRQWLPVALHMSTWFLLKNVRDFYNAVDIHGQHQDLLSERLSRHLRDPKYRNLANFLQHLHGQHSIDRPMLPTGHIPVPFQHNFSIPSRHLIGHQSQHHGIAPGPAPAPATNKPEDIPEADFLKIAQRLPRDWPHLGIKLGVEYSTIERLRRSHHFDSVPATLEMFKIWKELKGKSATKKALKKALNELNFGRLADEL